MKTWAYPAALVRHADDEFVVSFRNIPEALTGADTEAEALALAADALEEAILARLAAGRNIPAPTRVGRDERLVPLDPTTAARAALATAMRDQHVSNVALAQKLDKSEGAVRRLVDGRSGVKIETVLEALAAMGQRATLAFL